MKQPTYLERAVVVAIAVAITITVAVSNSSAATVWTQTYDGNTATNTAMNTAVLTADGADTFNVQNFKGNLFTTAPTTNTGGNLREAIWPAGTTAVKNSQSCATWVGESNVVDQEGIALRITKNGTTTRAITLTKNVIYGVNWVFNVHTWDSSSATPFTALAQFDMGKAMTNPINQMQYMPWRVCTRVIDSTLTFKIWFPDSMSEPSWTDSTYSRTLTNLPAAYVVPGYTGWYIGHIPAGGNTQYNNLALWKQSQ